MEANKAFLRACSNPRRLYSDSMTQAVAQILEEAEQLSAAERAELADRIVESLPTTSPRTSQQPRLPRLVGVSRRLSLARSHSFRARKPSRTFA